MSIEHQLVTDRHRHRVIASIRAVTNASRDCLLTVVFDAIILSKLLYTVVCRYWC